MKNNLLFYFYFVILIILVSCNSKDNKSEVNAETFISLNLSSPEKELPLSYFIDSVRTLRLTLPDSLLFGSVLRIMSDGKNFYVADSKQHVVFRFNKNGDFLNTIGKRGGGPGEYTRLGRCFLGNNSVYIDDLNIRKIFRYTPEGEFVRDISFPFSMVYNDIVSLPNGNFLCNELSCSKKNPERGLWIMNDKGERVETILVKSEIYPYISSDFATLSQDSNNVVYTYSPPSGEFYRYDFHKKDFRKTYQLRPDIKMLSDFKGHSEDFNLKIERADCTMAVEANNYLFALWLVIADKPQAKSVYTLYDKQTGDVRCFSNLTIDSQKLFSIGTFVSSNIPNAIVCYLPDEYTQEKYPEEYKKLGMKENVLIVQVLHFK